MHQFTSQKAKSSSATFHSKANVEDATEMSSLKEKAKTLELNGGENVKVELRFKPISALSSDGVIVIIEGEPRKVHELLEAVEERAKTWESWEEK
jgi:hypothetical protein